MTGDEQVILKAACVQAAATLVAVWWPLVRPNIQVSQQELEGHACTCARIADIMYTAVSGVDWKVSPKVAPGCGLPG